MFHFETLCLVSTKLSFLFAGLCQNEGSSIQRLLIIISRFLSLQYFFTSVSRFMFRVTWGIALCPATALNEVVSPGAVRNKCPYKD